tara:strand:- start:1135 stop:1374 length:240 start_codon:yes stop_codon:yes gene_type:complete
MPHHIIKDLKIKKQLDKINSLKIIDFDNYFAYSGKEEKTNYMTAYLMQKEKKYRSKFAVGIKNDMSKYKFKIKSNGNTQ